MSQPRISSYVTSRNSLSMEYPIETCLNSLLEFSDEIVVVDTSDDTDGTKDFLQNFQLKFGKERVVVLHKPSEIWELPNHGVYDGLMKAEARAACTGDWLWQMDLDEVVPKEAAPKIKRTVQDLHDSFLTHGTQAIYAYPVMEFWGSKGKIRLDINLEKPRLSYNDPNITHGIPAAYRKYVNGVLFSDHGSDGCNYIHKTTYQPIGWVTCLPHNIHQLQHAAKTDIESAKWLSSWVFNTLLRYNPYVEHYSWYSIERKIKNYKMFWAKSWQSLYGEPQEESDNPMFPGRTWSQVTDEDIASFAARLEEETGGWIFHQPWDGSQINAMRKPE